MIPRKQFCQLRFFERELPSRLPELTKPQKDSNIINAVKELIGEGYRPSLTGFQMWLPEPLHFEPKAESMFGQLIYKKNPFLQLIKKDIDGNDI